MLSDPDAPITSVELLGDFVGRWAERTPDAVAVEFEGSRRTWRQWRQRIDGVAAGLGAAGIGRGDRIAFLGKNNPACLEVVFAAAAIGAATVIVNWRQAGEELRYQLADSHALVLFAGAEIAPEAIAAATSPAIRRVIVVGGAQDEYETFTETVAGANSRPAVADTDDAVVIYSSGTTGRPKGVVLSQRALVAHTRNVGAAFPFLPGDANLVAMPLFHVGGICYAFFGIRAGVRTVMTREPKLEALTAAIESGATHAFFVPPVIAAILGAGAPAIAAVAGLRYLGYGAAPMPLSLLRKALDAWPSLNFVQVYGQTELSGVVSALAPCDHRDRDEPGRLLSAGRVVAGAEVRVADIGTGDALPAGAQGELWFRTTQRMTEYLNHPESTRETITSDGWLRTGDIGHLDESGYIYVEDRLKDMIITGGENVYGPEVERVLFAHPAVADAAIVGVPDDRWGESVKAIVVTTEPASAEDIIAFCRDRLAGFKCPTTVEFLPELPRNPSGKILKRQLREPYWRGRTRQI